MKYFLALTLMVVLIPSVLFSAEIFEGRSTPKATKAEAIRDAENDLASRISRSIAMQMAARSERIRTAVGSGGTFSSNYSHQDTLQTKALVSWSGFKAELVGIDSSMIKGEKLFEARVKTSFDRQKFVDEKRTKVKVLAQEWERLASKPLVTFLEAMPRFYEDYDREAMESQPAETMSDWKALSAAIDSVFAVQLNSLELVWTPKDNFDPCSRLKVAGNLSAFSKGAPVKPAWLEVTLDHSRFKTKAESDAMQISYTGKCQSIDSIKASVRVRGISQVLAQKTIPINANTVHVKIRGGSLPAEQDAILTRIGDQFMRLTGFNTQVDPKKALFVLHLDPKMICEAPSMREVQTCRARIGLTLKSSTGVIWEHAIESKGYGDTEEQARFDALKALDPAED